MKVKQCSACGFEGALWQSSPKLCKTCAMKAKAESMEPSTRKVKTNTETKSYKKVYSTISPISEKQSKRLAEYRKVRDQFLKENPFCKICGTTNDISLHHSRGRIGELLIDTAHFVTLCLKHHEQAEREPWWAKQMGISKSRLDK